MLGALVAVLCAACGESSSARLGVEGASCTKTADCESPLQCIKSVCTSLAEPEDVGPETPIHFADTRPTETTDAGNGEADSSPPDTKPQPCAGNEDCSEPTPVCNLYTGACVRCLENSDCPAGLTCFANECTLELCEANSKWCEGNSAYKCDSEGTGYESSVACGEKVCIDGECKECEPGKKKCDGKDVLACSPQGDAWNVEQTCTGELGCVNGLCIVCYPGSKECQEGDSYDCAGDGSGWMLAEKCTNGCNGGICSSQCGSDPKMSNVGCDYWAVDLDNAIETDPLGITIDAENQQYAVAVANTSATAEAKVTVTNAQGTVATGTVPKSSLYTFNLPSANVTGSTKQKLAYRVTSTIPIVVYQFNPSENKGVFSNDASLLLPVHSLGTEYYVVSHVQDDPVFRGFATIVGVKEGDTHVTVTPSAAVISGNGVPSMAAGTPTEFTLQQYEVLNLETASMGQDLTGTHIVSDQPVAVFGGVECGTAPVMNVCEGGKCKGLPSWSCSGMQDCLAVCCCDHMEHMMIPVPAWGTTYAVGHSKFRGNESDVFVVIAAKEGTTVTADPMVAAFPVLGAGEHFEFETRENFKLTANQPVLIVHFLAGEQAPNPNPDQCMMGICLSSLAMCTTEKDCGPSALQVAGDAGTGDPSSILLPAVEQWRNEYLILVPQFYKGGNYLTLVYPAGTSVLLDGGQVGAGTPFAGSQYAASVVPVSEGTHKLTSDTGFGVMVHGYDQYVSYGYAGGMNVQVIK